MGAPTKACVVLAALCLTLTAWAQSPDDYVGFIRVNNGTRFVDSQCKEFLFSGWHLLEAAANKMSFPGYGSGREYITAMFKKARQHRLNILRFFIIGDDSPTRIVLMESPGKFSEEAFQGIDFILNEAALYGIKLTIVPLNLWKKNNGVPAFETYCGTDKLNSRPGGDRLQAPYDWYNIASCRQIYKDYLTAIANRRNTFNGLLYKDDPVIFSWNLINEPRCVNCGPQAITAWIEDVAKHLKTVAPNHLVTTGEEGFYDASDPLANFNPASWASYSGQDFSSNHASPYIDYAVIHLWPDNWKATDLQFGKNWITTHSQAARALKKPLVVEEYGKNSQTDQIQSVRDPWFKMVHGLVDESLATGGPLRGVLFWEWDVDGTGPRDGSASTVREEDSTFKNEIVPFSTKVATTASARHKSGASRVPGCTPVPYAPSQPAVVAAGGKGEPSASPAPNGRRKLLLK